MFCSSMMPGRSQPPQVLELADALGNGAAELGAAQVPVGESDDRKSVE